MPAATVTIGPRPGEVPVSVNSAPAVHARAGRRRDWRLLQIALVTLDVTALLGAIAVSYVLRRWLGEVLPLSPIALNRYLLDPLLIIPVQVLIFRLHGLYDFDRILAGTREYQHIVRSVTIGMFFVIGMSFFTGEAPIFSRSWLVLVWLVTIGCVGSGRFAIRRAVRQLRRRGTLRTRVVIVGASAFGVAVAEQFQAAKDEGLDVVGFLDEYVPLGHRLLGHLAVIGHPRDLLDASTLDLADEYVLIPNAVPHERLEALMLLMVAQDTPTVRLAVTSGDLLTNSVLVAERVSVPLVTLRQARIVGIDMVLKRSLDLSAAALGLILLAPVTLALLARAYLAGIRPLTYGQLVAAAGGRTMTVWLLGPGVARSLLIRGVPALLAVLRGQISLVGPRPVVQELGGAVKSNPELVAVQPGITGPWRLAGTGASLEDQTMRDLIYVRNYTIWEDLRILLESAVRLLSAAPLVPLGRWQCQESVRER